MKNRVIVLIAGLLLLTKAASLYGIPGNASFSISTLYDTNYAYPGKTYSFVGTCTNTAPCTDAASGIDSTYIRFKYDATSYYTVMFYFDHGNTSAFSETTGDTYNDLVTASCTYTLQYTTLICTYAIKIGWSLLETTGIPVEMRVVDEAGASDGFEQNPSGVTFNYENDLRLVGNLSNNYGIVSGGWTQSSLNVTWSGCTVYFQGSNTTSPENNDFDIQAVTDNGDIFTQSGGAELGLTVTTDSVQDTSEACTFTIVNIPGQGTFDTTTTKYIQFQVDAAIPNIILNDNYYVFKGNTAYKTPFLDIDFGNGGIGSQLDTAQYQVNNVWYTIFSTDVDTYTQDFKIDANAYSSLNYGENQIPVRVFDKAWVDTKYITINMETITIDGSVSDWKGDEYMELDSSENLRFLLAWDDTSLYFGYYYKDLNAGDGGSDGDFFVYFDCINNSGTSGVGVAWYGPHNLPTSNNAKWDYAVCIEDGGYYDLRQNSGGAWSTVEDNASFTGEAYIGYNAVQVTEVRLRWDRLTNNQGKPDTFSVFAFQQYESSGDVWTSYPTKNPGGGAAPPVTFTYYYYYYDSSDTFPPNSVVDVLINVDAGLGEWPDTAKLPAVGPTDFRIIWDVDFLYGACNRGSSFTTSASEYDVIMLYIDTGTDDFGTYTSVDWNGSHNLPFRADWVFMYAPYDPGSSGNEYKDLRKWTGGAWSSSSWNGTGAKHTSNGTLEFSIKWDDIGGSKPIKVVYYIFNGANGYLWGSSPNANPTGTDPQTLSAYIQYPDLNQAISNLRAYYYTRCTEPIMTIDSTVTSPFTPTIDGTKDAAWGSIPLASSSVPPTTTGAPDSDDVGDDGKTFPDGLCKSIYVTNDINYLYIGWEAMGDHYDLETDKSQQSAHYGFLFITDTYPAGCEYDPWKSSGNTRCYKYAADFWVEGYIGYGLNDFSGMIRYVASQTDGSWASEYSLVDGTDYKVSVSSGFGEFRIPLSTLGVSNGDSIGIIYYGRHSAAKPGINDITPGVTTADPGYPHSDWADENS
ncbi:MAG: hypothetical protein AB1765_07010, partial [Candidatus Hydrogenedentota bacterium]